uniref:Uncharacterized protein n=1 Tax=Vitis vinifera TaxID=29760 RepID=F6HS37_VITVI
MEGIGNISAHVGPAHHAHSNFATCPMIYEGAQAIEGLFLDRCKFNPSHLNRESFKEMNRLRLLKIRSYGPAFLTCAPTRSARLAFIW